jgi:hypothetical protein
LLGDRRNAALLQQSVGAAFGPGIELVLRDRAVPIEAPPPPDSFTREVVDLFGGRVEEAPRGD